jgi:hypothetical protein
MTGRTFSSSAMGRSHTADPVGTGNVAGATGRMRATARHSSLTKLPAITERDFQRQVTDLAKLFGWALYHPMLSKWSERGWPDLALCRPPRLVFIELKRENGKTTPHQDRWLSMLHACPGVETHLFRPSELPQIAELLR